MNKMPGYLTSDQVPPILRRRFLRIGYRQLNRNWMYYVRSTLRLHNESVNIWTHAVPIIYFAAHLLLDLLDYHHSKTPSLVLQIGIMWLLVGSTLAHTFHSRSTFDHYRWFLVDLFGIAHFSLGVGLQRYAYCQTQSTHDDGPLWARIYLPSLLIICSFYFALNAYMFVCHTFWGPRPLFRMLVSFVMALWVYVPVWARAHYVAIDGVTSAVVNVSSVVAVGDASVVLHERAGYWLLLAGVFLGGHVPERWAPGRFDLFGYGHQLFHICILMVAKTLLEASKLDAIDDRLDALPLGWTTVAASVTLLTAVVFVCFYCLLPIARTRPDHHTHID